MKVIDALIKEQAMDMENYFGVGNGLMIPIVEAEDFRHSNGKVRELDFDL